MSKKIKYQWKKIDFHSLFLLMMKAQDNNCDTDVKLYRNGADFFVDGKKVGFIEPHGRCYWQEEKF